MGVVSGIFSVIEVPGSAPVTAMRGWKLASTDGIKPIFHSGTNAGAQRNTGVRDWTGVFQGYGAGDLPVFPGETFSFKGQFEGLGTDAGDSKGVVCDANLAICDRIEITWHGEQGKEVEYATFFSANGAIDLNTTLDLDEDTSFARPPTAVAMTLAGPTPVTSLRSMKLVIRAANIKYSDASTGGWTRRTPGNIDGGCVYSVYVDESDLPALEAALQTNKVFQLNYSSTEAWQITWMRMLKIELDANRESAENVFATITSEFNLCDGTSLGTIKSGATASYTEHWPSSGGTIWPRARG